MRSGQTPVFISSTWLDLLAERKAIQAVLQRFPLAKFVGMENFDGWLADPLQTSLAELDSTKIYVGIFAARYGSGITEAEYHHARERGMPCLIYLKDAPPDATPQARAEHAAELQALKERLKATHIISHFTSPDDLAIKIATDLHRLLFQLSNTLANCEGY